MLLPRNAWQRQVFDDGVKIRVKIRASNLQELKTAIVAKVLERRLTTKRASELDIYIKVYDADFEEWHVVEAFGEMPNKCTVMIGDTAAITPRKRASSRHAKLHFLRCSTCPGVAMFPSLLSHAIYNVEAVFIMR